MRGLEAKQVTPPRRATAALTRSTEPARRREGGALSSLRGAERRGSPDPARLPGLLRLWLAMTGPGCLATRGARQA